MRMPIHSHLLSALCLTLAGFFLAGCEKALENDRCATSASITASSTLAQDQQLLVTLYDELVDLSGSSSCTSADRWRITPYGAMACGGPAGYLAYKTNIDEACFLKKVAHLTQQQEQFNRKHGAVSPCVIMPMPRGVNCVDGKIVFMY